MIPVYFLTENGEPVFATTKRKLAERSRTPKQTLVVEFHDLEKVREQALQKLTLLEKMSLFHIID